MSHVKVKFRNKDGLKLVGDLTTPSAKPPWPTIIMCHGFSSSKDSKSYTGLERRLLVLGIASFRFNYRGHGQSEGDWKNLTISGIVEDITSAIDYLLKNHKDIVEKDKLILYGGSFSGLPVIAVASKDKRIKYLICRSGVIDAKKRLERFYNIKKWKEKGYVKSPTNQPKLKKFSYSLYRDSLEYNGFKLAKKIKIPTLLLHATKDVNVKPFHSIELFKNLNSKDKTLKLIKGVNHWYHGKRREMQQTMVDWIKTQINS